MIINENRLITYRLADSQYLNSYTKDFAEARMLLTPQEIGQFLLLNPASCADVWKPDVVKEALTQWRIASENPATAASARVAFDLALKSAAQSNNMPRMFLRKLAQLRYELYPLRLVKNLTMYYNTTGHELSPSQEGYQPANDFFYIKSYDNGKDWLSHLAVSPNEKIYVARNPEQTFVMSWSTFLAYWDAFYCDRFCTLNVIDDDTRWFLFLHDERTAIWGCTADYATEKGVTNAALIQSAEDSKMQFAQSIQEKYKLKIMLDEEYKQMHS